LRTYDERYPKGELAQERAAAGVLAHCAAGRTQLARAEARQFLERWPRSPLVVRIQGSCAGEGETR
jgi:outer membrane protein assembly factor BamD (BamD/ComL family)